MQLFELRLPVARDGRVTDVGVDLRERRDADRHRFERLRQVHRVGGDHHAAAGDWAAARQAHYDLYDLFTVLFLDTNPVPVKAAMAMLGLVEEVYRLPLCPTSADVKAQLRTSLVAHGLL